MSVEVVARCVHGLEWVCADEVAERLPAAERIRFARREVAFRLPAAAPALLDLRTADDVLLSVGNADAASPDDAAAALGRLPWEECVEDVRALRPVPSPPVLDVVAAVEGHRFTRFDVENAVGPLLAARLGGTYLRRTAAGREPGEPDVTLRVTVRDGAATAAVRIAAHPLHRRPWKLDTGPGTLHPPVAAALVRLAAPRESVLDPFCGDGTVAIEAVLARPAARVVGRDLDPARLENARRNAARAGVVLDLGVADAAGTDPTGFDAGFDAVVTNPPWNLAVGGAGRLRRGLDPLWRRLPRVLAPDGRIVVVTDAALDAPAASAAAGLHPGLAVRMRVAGRLSDVVLASPAGRPALPEALHRWRQRALAAEVGL